MTHEEEIEALEQEIGRAKATLEKYANALGDEDPVIRAAIRWLLASVIVPQPEWNDLVRKANAYDETCATLKEMAR